METPILDMLNSLPDPGARFHMPGHKGRLDPTDITELSGTDNLLVPRGCIARSQQLCAEEQGAARAFFSVNGSSACALAALLPFGPGEKVIVGRDVHMSALHALSLSGATPVWVELEMELGEVPLPVSAVEVCKKIEENPDAKAVYVTYPNAYGMCCDLGAICKKAHEAGMQVIADSAHGAHFPYHPALPKTAGEWGADLWFVSFHKTLPARNQSAVLLSARATDEPKRWLNLVQTTSPAYPILASMDYARAFMAQEGGPRLEERLDWLEEVKSRLPEGIIAKKTDDPTRLVLDVSRRGGGFAASAHLESHDIYVESADPKHLVLICTVFDEKEDYEKLLAGLEALPKEEVQLSRFSYRLRGDMERLPAQCLRLPRERVPAEETVGRLAGEDAFVYPPGVPVLLAGQRIRKEDLALLRALEDAGCSPEWTGLVLADKSVDKAESSI